MAQSLRLVSGVDRSPAQRASSPRSVHPRRTEWSTKDRELARLNNVNLFVFGADDVVAEFVTSLWRDLVAPIEVRHRGEPLRLSPTAGLVATMIVYGVDTLTREEQHALHRWLNAENGRARVVSTASESLLPMLDTGAFSDALYYRLNVVTIDLTSPVAP